MLLLLLLLLVILLVILLLLLILVKGLAECVELVAERLKEGAERRTLALGRLYGLVSLGRRNSALGRGLGGLFGIFLLLGNFVVNVNSGRNRLLALLVGVLLGILVRILVSILGILGILGLGGLGDRHGLGIDVNLGIRVNHLPVTLGRRRVG